MVRAPDLHVGGRNLMHLKLDIFQTTLGWIAVIANNNTLKSTSLPEPTREQALEAALKNISGEVYNITQVKLPKIRKSIMDYCAGEDYNFTDISIDTHNAPPFFKKAWHACRTIPLGETRTYRWIAVESGSPNAARASGQAMARNRFPLIIPCHRVLGSDDKLHGFGGTLKLDMKAQLLKLEAEMVNSKLVIKN